MIFLIVMLFAAQLHAMSGVCTHVGKGWNGRQGASGVRYDHRLPMAAHRTLPFGTVVKVINADPRSPNRGKSVQMIIIDRGPVSTGRCLDAMPAPLWELAGKRVGGLRVRLEVASTRCACEGYRCLAKELGTTHMTMKIFERCNRLREDK